MAQGYVYLLNCSVQANPDSQVLELCLELHIILSCGSFYVYVFIMHYILFVYLVT